MGTATKDDDHGKNDDHAGNNRYFRGSGSKGQGAGRWQD